MICDKALCYRSMFNKSYGVVVGVRGLKVIWVSILRKGLYGFFLDVHKDFLLCGCCFGYVDG